MSDDHVTLGEAFEPGEVGDKEETISFSLRELIVLQQLFNLAPERAVSVLIDAFGEGWLYAMTSGQMKIADRVGRMVDAPWVREWAATMQAEVDQQMAEWREKAA